MWCVHCVGGKPMKYVPLPCPPPPSRGVLMQTRKDADKAMIGLNGILLHDFELKIGWGKAVPLPPTPLYTLAGGSAPAAVAGGSGGVPSTGFSSRPGVEGRERGSGSESTQGGGSEGACPGLQGGTTTAITTLIRWGRVGGMRACWGYLGGMPHLASSSVP